MMFIIKVYSIFSVAELACPASDRVRGQRLFKRNSGSLQHRYPLRGCGQQRPISPSPAHHLLGRWSWGAARGPGPSRIAALALGRAGLPGKRSYSW